MTQEAQRDSAASGASDRSQFQAEILGLYGKRYFLPASAARSSDVTRRFGIAQAGGGQYSAGLAQSSATRVGCDAAGVCTEVCPLSCYFQTFAQERDQPSLLLTRLQKSADLLMSELARCIFLTISHDDQDGLDVGFAVHCLIEDANAAA